MASSNSSISDKVKGVDLSTSDTLVNESEYKPPSSLSPLRKYSLLLIFCLAQFLDVFNNSALLAAIPIMARQMQMTGDQSVWIISATQLTFAAFLLLSGRISDVYNTKYSFVSGIFGLGIVTLITAFMTDKIAVFVLRAISGIFASLTIPSALNLIVKLFPDPTEQSRAISLFGACGAVGNVLGLIIGAILVQYADWRWVFWFATLVAIPVSVLSLILIPSQRKTNYESSKMQGLDIIGVSILTAALILLVFGVTTGSSSGWGSAMTLAPLIISIFMIVAFFVYEARIPEEKAAVPPRIWFYPNFSVLFATALFLYLWWYTVFFVYTNLWQTVYEWSAIITAVHTLPIGVTAFAISFTGPLSRKINPKWLILIGEIGVIIGTILLPFANSKDRYWSLVFPGFAIGSGGAMLAFVHSNIAIFRSTPTRMAGTVGAMYNSALQLGSAIGTAAVTSIQTSIQSQPGKGGPNGYEGRADGLWFLFAVVVIETIAAAIFYKPKRTEYSEEEDTAPTSEATTTRNEEKV